MALPKIAKIKHFYETEIEVLVPEIKYNRKVSSVGA
jgi:hypothetical protein